MAEGQAMKALLNEAFGGGESSPNPFLLLWSYRRVDNYAESRFWPAFLFLKLFIGRSHEIYGIAIESRIFSLLRQKSTISLLSTT